MLVYQTNKCLYKSRVVTPAHKTNRLANARALAKAEGRQVDFGEKLGMSESQVSQIIGRNPSRSIGDDTAARIEDAYLKPGGWLDEDQSDAVIIYHQSPLNGDSVHEDPAHITVQKSALSDYSLVPRYNIRAGLGRGEPIHSEQITDNLAFKAEWLEKLGVRRGMAACVQCIGDSMLPTVRHGDIALIDLGAIKTANGVFALSLPLDDTHEVIVKRLQWRTNGDLWVVSDNKERYPEPEIYGPDFDVGELRIIGRVVWVGGTVQ